MSLIILFGPTGAGKTYTGRLLEKNFGYYFYDGDADLTQEMKRALNSMSPITDLMRGRFISRLLDSIEKLAKNHPDLVVAQTFIKEKYRQQLLKRWPKAKFILVKTNEKLRHERRRRMWNEAYLTQMDALFERPKIEHRVITNDSNGPDNLRAKLQGWLSALS